MSFKQVGQNTPRLVDEFKENGCNSIHKETGEQCGYLKGYYAISGPDFSVWCCDNCNRETTIFRTKEDMERVLGKGLGPQNDGSIKIQL